MTFSILVRDAQSGAFGGAAATGSLCVGGWVLRGAPLAGVTASQGAAPSTFWGEEALSLLASGRPAQAAVDEVTGADPGRASRQLSALGCEGRGAAFTGGDNTPEMGALPFAGGIAAGNMLRSLEVLDALAAGYEDATGPLGARLLAALRAAEAAGSDLRGLLSAALLVVRADAPPLTLRIDHHPDDPVGALGELHARATTGPYADWARQVPTTLDRHRVLD